MLKKIIGMVAITTIALICAIGGGGVLPLLIQQKKLTETFSSICSIIG